MTPLKLNFLLRICMMNSKQFIQRIYATEIVTQVYDINNNHYKDTASISFEVISDLMNKYIKFKSNDQEFTR